MYLLGAGLPEGRSLKYEVEEIVRKRPKLSGYILEISLQVTLVQKSKSG